MAQDVAARFPHLAPDRRDRGLGRAARALAPLLLLSALVAVGGAALPGLAGAQTTEPPVITYQGRLRGPGGNAISGFHQLTLRIYNVRTGPDPALWVEVHPAVQVTNGDFTVEMGSITPLDTLDFSQKFFLEIQVDSDPPMSPRLAMTSIGHAFQALRARAADHADGSTHADRSDRAIGADRSDRATGADRADRATGADRADRATAADTADVATTCCTTLATAAGYAVTATTAGHATTADSATTAATADHAATADSATTAVTVGHATTAETADVATTCCTTPATAAGYANRALKRTEGRHATVVAALDSGPPGAGSRYYTSPLDAMADLAAWCDAPSAANPCVLTLMPGVYTLPPGAFLQLVSGVTIQGSGEAATRIVGTGGSPDQAPPGVVRGADGAELRGLTIEGTEVTIPAFQNPVTAGWVRLRQVSLLAPGTAVDNRGFLNITDAEIGGCIYPTRDCVANEGPLLYVTSLVLDRVVVTPTNARSAVATLTSLTLTNVRIAGTAVRGLEQSFGLVTATNLTIDGPIDGIVVDLFSSLALRGSSISGRGLSISVPGVALTVGTFAEARIQHSIIQGGSIGPPTFPPSGIRLVDGSSRAKVGSSQISGGVEGAALTCVFAYDGYFAPLNATCR